MYVALMVFSATLLLAVLLSNSFDRSVLSSAVIFLVAGFLVEPEVLGVFHVAPRFESVSAAAELALVVVLFSDALRLAPRHLRAGGGPAARALALGLPLSIVITAVVGRMLLHLTWTDALLVGAVLSPTDPVFSAAIVGRKEVPRAVRSTLSVESGLNDGLALPAVLLLVDRAGGPQAPLGHQLVAVLGGVALGIGISLVAVELHDAPFFESARRYKPLEVLAVGLMVLASSKLLQLNSYLAVFASGLTLAFRSPALAQSFDEFGKLLAELAKLAAVMLLGAIFTPRFFTQMPPLGYLFAVVALVLVRPVALKLALLGTGIRGRQFATVAWFGPKGFSSILYGLLMAPVPNAPFLISLVALTVALSIIAHSSTDVGIARWFRPEGTERRA